MYVCCLFFQAEDGIRDLVRSRGLGDVYKRQLQRGERVKAIAQLVQTSDGAHLWSRVFASDTADFSACLLYTSDAADERSSVDLGGRRIIKKKNKEDIRERRPIKNRNTREKIE